MQLTVDSLPFLTELAAVTVFTVAYIETRRASLHKSRSLVGCAVYGWVLEHLNIKLFGTYHYPDVYVFRLGEVPLFIPVGWALVIHSAMAISNRLNVHRLAKPLLDGLLAVLLDIAIDAVAIRLGLWRWTVPSDGNRPLGFDEGWFGVPPGNLTGWMWVAASYSFFWHAFHDTKRTRRWGCWREILIVPFAYAGLLAGMYLSGMAMHSFDLKSESQKLWVFAWQVFIFLAIVLIASGSTVKPLTQTAEVPLTLRLLRWGAHLGALGALITTGIWRDTPALLTVSLATIAIEGSVTCFTKDQPRQLA